MKSITNKLSKLTGASGILFATIVVVNLGNYLINLLLGRILGPEEFAEAGVLATGVLVLSFVALGFQMTAAKYSAVFESGSSGTRSAVFSAWFSHFSVGLGVILAILLWLAAPFLAEYLHFRTTTPLLIIAIGIPLYLGLSAGRGFLQGRLQFKRLAASYFMEMIGRLLVTGLILVALMYWGGDWISEGIAIGFLAAFVVAFLVSRRGLTWQRSVVAPEERSSILKFMLIVGAYELSQILISHSDVILVKHYFTNEESGLYNALALIGRVVFFATWSVVTLLFPKVVQREQQGLPHLHLFYRSLLIVLGVGVGITVACFGFSDLIIWLLFGSAFASAGQLLWLYALATTLFACANVFAYYYMSLNRYLPVVLSGLAGLGQILMINLFHESISTVIYVQILMMGLLFLSMVTFHIIKNQKNEKTENSLSISLSAQ